jgi:response regulator RpfG family c-di-GMP phosphodiesterase
MGIEMITPTDKSIIEPGELLNVLVVDDNASVLRFLVLAFRANGCVPVEASTAEQALELLKGQRFDLVVSDIKMPGLSGLDLLRAVKSSQPATPVVLITGAPSVNSAVFGLRHGAYDYLSKPFAIQDVQELVRRFQRDREDRRVALPAGLTDELARRQYGVEVLFRIGQLALEGAEPGAFIETVLGYAMESLRAAAAMIVLRDENGTFKATQKGQPETLQGLAGMLSSAFDRLVSSNGQETIALADSGTLSAIAAVVPGLGGSVGILCVARDAEDTAFLPDERELLLGYAQTTAVALQKILLRENVEQNLVDTITAFVNAIESKDRYLKGHSARVSVYSAEIGRVLGMSDADVLVVSRAGMLHDLGKLVMLDSILGKPGRLTPEEFDMMKTHPVVGDRILAPLRFLAREAQAVRYHHERYDGEGYPDKLQGEAIPFIARVVTVADAFDAMTSNRPYRAARSVEVAREEIRRVSGTQLDPSVAAAFCTIPVEKLDEISRSFEHLTPEGDQAGSSGLPCAQAAAVMNG